MGRKDVLYKVLEAAGEFNSRKLWRRFTNSDCFGVKITGQACSEGSRGDERMLGTVLGNAGEEYGLSLFRGPGAAGSFTALLASDGLGDDVLEEMDLLGFTMEAFGELLPEDQAQLRQAGLHPRYVDHVPYFLAKPPGRRARPPDKSEMELLHLVLRGMVEADKKRLLHPARLDDEEGIPVLTISGEAAAPHVAVTREHWPRPKNAKTIPLLGERLDLRGLPRLRATWLVGMPTVPAGIEGDERTMRMLLVVDEASEFVLEGKPVLGGDLREATKIVAATFRSGGLGGQKGLPDKIVFSSRKLFDVITPTLEAAGVRCVYEPMLPILQELVADLVGHLDQGFSLFDENTKSGNEAEAKIPAPDDLKSWKEADLRLMRRFAEHFQSGRQLWSRRAVKRYFNEDEDLEFYLKDPRQPGIIPAYTAWGVLDYRPNRTSKTHAEKVLAKGLPKPEEILLRARMEACPTLYRVAGHNPKVGTVELEDVLLGGAVTVHDQMMSENIENSLFLAARVFPVGRFHFIEPAGPLFGAMMGLDGVEFLRGVGMEFTSEGLQRDAHKFGWLWRWADRWRDRQKLQGLRNTDGEEFLWHTASFSLANPDQTRQTLMRRKDVDFDEETDELVWSKEAGRGSGMPGQTVTLGRIEFVDDELVLTVNSAERFARARQWLEKLPGVVFSNVRTRRWDEAEKDRPMDERICPPEPVEMTPELAASLQEMMDRHYIEWIDTPLPALGGKTPRQACRTEVGRRQVTMLIRTMPDPMGQVPVQVPREAMLSELGLEKESSLTSSGRQKPQPSIPIQEISPKRKVPRNAPCPCGSGRKYKKCCGR